MKEPVVNYRKFKFSRLNTPEFCHLKWLGSWIIFAALYIGTEKFVKFENCHIIHCALDDLIPFNEYFVIFYCLWYIAIAFTSIYFLLYDSQSFVKLQKFFLLTQVIAMTICVLYPSRQELRPIGISYSNIFTWILFKIYSVDTPTGVFPSVHVIYSLGMASAWAKTNFVNRNKKIIIFIFAFMISISTTFVKQHSVLDILGAIPVFLIGYYLIYNKKRTC